MDIAKLIATLGLDNTEFLDTLESSVGDSASFTDRLSSIGGAVVMGTISAVATGVAAIGAAAWNSGNTVDEAMDTIALATGKTGPALDALRGDFGTVFSSVPTDAGSAAEAIGILNSRLDVTGPELTNLAAPLLEATRLLGGDITANAEGFSRVIGDWSIPVASASSSLDVLFVAAQEAGAPLDGLMERIVQYGAPMRNFGFTFEESAAMLAKWEAEGVNVETVMGGMRIASGKFISQGKDMNQGLFDTVEAIQAATEAGGLKIATDVFGAKAAGDMYDVIRSGKFDIEDMVAAITNASGGIMDASKSTMDWREKLELLGNKATLALAPIGQQVMDAVGGAIDGVTQMFERPDIQAGITNFTTIIGNGISRIVTYIPILIDGFFSFISFLQNNQGIVVGVLAALGVAATAWGVTTAAAAWTAMAPLLPVIAVLALVGVAAYLLYEAWTNNWGGIQEKTQAAWTWITNAFTTGKDFIQNLWSGFLNFLDALNSGKLGWISQIWQNVLEAISIWFDTFVANIKSIFNLFSLAFEGDWRGFGEELRAIWDRSWEAIGKILSLAWDNLSILVSTLIDNVVTFFRDTDWQELGRMIVAGIVDGLQAMAGWALDQIVSFGQGIADVLAGFFQIGSPSKLMAKMIGEPLAMGVVVGWEHVLDTNPFEGALAGVLGATTYTPEMRMNATDSVVMETGGSGAITIQFTYSPAVSLGDRYEAEQVLAPMIVEAVRRRMEQEA